ncbi:MULTISPECIES: CheR family methyltransferase [unclassified Afipia]|uniref:CheR family methyltransferase n=1 Tax=unclassified Afipia TaxID=2642050 RepID=UPI0004678C44|nr:MULTISPECIES: CheR family methyltransferase [unclassified Afipia]MAH71681.1 chemotaxis protein CheR [Afipia sp.]OUX59157.1 MAG: chemotaxis protein CheR [Afipia sp. TMED4]HAO42359.1 methyltransferase domain-containing protein [Afipia sp.]HAP13166.1 methyltransferase domain-containing protein [Afipia sp.]HBF56582.1 methyltransferase domain-containing protein [Afipia sp.]
MMHAMSEAVVHLSDRHFRSIAELIEGQVGIKLPAGKRLMLEGRLHKRVRALNYSCLDEYVERLFEAGQFDAEFTHLIDVVTTNKTDFFREPSHFSFMKEVAVPDLLKSARGSSRGLKIWSSACSTGMEAYSAAMVLDDLVRAGSRFQFRILGTDISTSVLRIAEAAIYTREVIAPVPEALAKRYFLSSKDQSRAEVRVVPELRRSAHFMRMNLMDSAYPVDRDVDIIFCRNVLIYFDKKTQRKVVDQLCSHLRPGGYLMVGHSESMVRNDSPGLRQVQPTIFKV